MILGAVFVPRIDVAGKTTLVNLMPACGDHHHDVVGGKDAAG